MSVFLLPDKKPFYAGTYFPPEPRYNHPGFAAFRENYYWEFHGFGTSFRAGQRPGKERAGQQ